MLLWGPDVTAGSAGGVGIFYVIARRTWEQAVTLLRDPSFDMVILDELNIVLRYDYLPLAEVLEELRGKRDMLHVVITGRNAKEELIDLADLVTEMRLIKHPYTAGIKAQRGVEFEHDAGEVAWWLREPGL